jgi:hypothetical protein
MERPFTVAQVSQALHGGAEAGRVDFSGEALREALPGALQAQIEKGGFATALSYALRQHDGTRYGDTMLRVERAGTDPHTKCALWRATQG